MRKLVVPFLLFFFILLSISVKAITITDVITNGYAWQSDAAGTYSCNGRIVFQSRVNSQNANGYIKFDVSSIPNGTINSATLSLHHYLTSNPATRYLEIYNTSLNWSASNLSWNVIPLTGTLIDNISSDPSTSDNWVNWTVTSALQHAVNTGIPLSLMIKDSSPNSSTKYLFEFIRAKGDCYYNDSADPSGTGVPQLIVNYSVADCTDDCGDCGCIGDSEECYVPPIIGSYCAVEEGAPNSIKTVLYSNCTNTSYFNCPANTFCSQITPVINISEYLSQSAGGMLDWCKGCWFINYRPDPIFHYNQLAVYATNCWNTATTPWTVYNECNCNQIGLCSSDIYETTNITNVPYSITQWSAGCFNPTTGKYANVVNATGKNTTIETMINATCPNCVISGNTTSNCLANTSTTCYDSNCFVVPCTVNNLGSCSQANLDYTSGFNCGIAGLLNIHDISTANMVSAVFITLFGSLAVAGMLVYLGVGGSMVGQSFLMSLLMFLVMFTFISWYPAWIMIILIIMGGLLVAKTLKVF